jgi:hypothetical protein
MLKRGNENAVAARADVLMNVRRVGNEGSEGRQFIGVRKGSG